MRNVDRYVGPTSNWLWDMLRSRRLQDLGSIGIDDHCSAGLLGCSVDSHHAINILSRAGDEHHSRCCFETLDEAELQFFFGWELLVITEPPQTRSLHQHDIDVLWRPLQHRLEQLSFIAVSAQVTGIEEPPAVSFDLKRIGVETGMINEMRRDGEWA